MWRWLVEFPIVCAALAWAATRWMVTVVGLGAFILTAGSLLALLFGVRWGW